MEILWQRKGFTLVEIIIVLVIIVILAAITIPALTGYIEDAQLKSSLALARNTFAEVNSILRGDDTREGSNYAYIVEWIDKAAITYKGPEDESVTTGGYTAPSHHDRAKHAIRMAMGDKVLPFGYRMYFTSTSDGRYMISKMEIFYKTPSNASILAETPDLTIGG